MVDLLMVRERFQVIMLQPDKTYGKPWCVDMFIIIIVLFILFRRGFT